jgi:hypothetical protein
MAPTPDTDFKYIFKFQVCVSFFAKLAAHLCCYFSKRGTVDELLFILNKSNDVFPVDQKKLLPRPLLSRNHKLEPVRTILSS